jgi:hypothetical protein
LERGRRHASGGWVGPWEAGFGQREKDVTASV